MNKNKTLSLFNLKQCFFAQTYCKCKEKKTPTNTVLFTHDETRFQHNLLNRMSSSKSNTTYLMKS